MLAMRSSQGFQWLLFDNAQQYYASCPLERGQAIGQAAIMLNAKGVHALRLRCASNVALLVLGSAEHARSATRIRGHLTYLIRGHLTYLDESQATLN